MSAPRYDLVQEDGTLRVERKRGLRLGDHKLAIIYTVFVAAVVGSAAATGHILWPFYVVVLLAMPSVPFLTAWHAFAVGRRLGLGRPAQRVVVTAGQSVEDYRRASEPTTIEVDGVVVESDRAAVFPFQLFPFLALKPAWVQQVVVVALRERVFHLERSADEHRVMRLASSLRKALGFKVERRWAAVTSTVAGLLMMVVGIAQLGYGAWIATRVLIDLSDGGPAVAWRWAVILVAVELAGALPSAVLLWRVLVGSLREQSRERVGR
ncbi:MAG: hypothetical protein JRI68_15460 [Deltaproteobacteria bacterium]|nr:hypothetical protein [Deltaproteobacteria bacterium]